MLERELAEIIDKIKKLWPRCTVLQNAEQAKIWKSKLDYYSFVLVNQAVNAHFEVASIKTNPDLNKILEYCRTRKPKMTKRFELPENYVPATKEEKIEILQKLADEGNEFAKLVLQDPNLNPLTMFKMKSVDEAIKVEPPKPIGAEIAKLTDERRPRRDNSEEQAEAASAGTRLPYADPDPEIDDDIPF